MRNRSKTFSLVVVSLLLTSIVAWITSSHLSCGLSGTACLPGLRPSPGSSKILVEALKGNGSIFVRSWNTAIPSTPLINNSSLSAHSSVFDVIPQVRRNRGIVLNREGNYITSARRMNISNELIFGGTGTPTRVLERSGLAGVEKACRLLPNLEVSTCMSRARETETVIKYEMEKIFQAASQRVNHSWWTWPGFDYSVANTTRVLAFTICTPGVGTSFDAIKGLCNAQREGMDIWGKRNTIDFRQIVDSQILDPERAPHWQKVAYMHAFLKLNYDIVLFLDADCMVAQAKWDIRAFVNRVLPPVTKKLWAFVDDTVDYHSTGEMFMRKHETSLTFLQDWYRLAAPFFDTTMPISALRAGQPGIATNPSEFVQNHSAGNGGLALRRRCHAHVVFHEQGCLGQFYSAAPHYLDNLAVFDSQKFRRVSWNGGSTPFFHACCRPREEAERTLRECSKKMKKYGSC